MAKLNFTPSQELAVYYPDGDLLISAAAGSGKTAALTSRIVYLVAEGRADLSEMLIVTFTKAAASEMRSRISKKLRDEIAESKNKDQLKISRLTNALSQLPSADISTIHSFLYKSLKPYFPTLNLSQDTSIVEEKEVERIKAEIMRDIVDDSFRDSEINTKAEVRNDSFLLLADIIGQTRDTNSIDEELLWLAKKLQEKGLGTDALREFADGLGRIADEKTPIFETDFGAVVLERLKQFCGHYRKVFGELVWEFENDNILNKAYGPALIEITEVLDRLGKETSSDTPEFERIKTILSSYKPSRLGTLKKENQTETSEIFKYFRDNFKKEITKNRENYFNQTEVQFHDSACRIAEILKTAHQVLQEYDRRLTQKKQAISIMEYADLEKYAQIILTDEHGETSEAARKIGERYRYIFVDEYQDTNAVQDSLFREISGNSVRFLVGDIKQSIYRFRGAEPRVFSDYRRIWPKVEADNYTEECINTGRSVFMSENFRCSKEIIRFINAISNHILPHGGIDYKREDELIFAQADDKPNVPVECVLVEKKRRKPGEEADEENQSVDPEAKYVAGRVKEMIGRYSEDGSRIIRPSDIAIILRSPTTDAQDYCDELEALGVSASTKVAKSPGEYCSILLLVSLLKFIDNPLRDIFAAAAMKSPIFGFTIEDIVKLRRHAGDLPLFTAVLDLAEATVGDEDELAEKCRKVTSFIREEKTLIGGISTEKYLEELLAKTNFYGMKEVREEPGERDALQKILAVAKEFDAKNRAISTSKSLYGFIKELDDRLDRKDDSAEIGKEDSVTILSIHASKGLEFPVCFLCEGAKSRNIRDETRTVLFDDTLGLGMQLPDSTGLVKCDTFIRRAVSLKMANDAVSEEMRMLYVALTRAKGKLIVTAKTADADKLLRAAQTEGEFSDAYSVLTADSYIDWILPAIAKNQHSDDWKVSVVSAEDILSADELPHVSQENDSLSVDITEKAEMIRERFDFVYPYDFLEKIPSKLVVSRLSPEILDEESRAEDNIVQSFSLDLTDSKADDGGSEISDSSSDERKFTLNKPKFLSEKQTAAANEVGNATHRFMQFVDFGRLIEFGEKEELRRLTDERFISQGDAELINIQQIRRFMQSSLLDKLTRSDFVKREFRFNVLTPAEEFTADDELRDKLRENNVKITVQGVVDCVYRDPDTGKLVLVDYKTDSIRAEEWHDQKKAEDRLRERHRNQLTYYRRICSEMFEEKIEEVYIYSTVLGRCIKI